MLHWARNPMPDALKRLCTHDVITKLISVRWYRTAITRCCTLGIVLVTHHDPTSLITWKIKARIAAHKCADNEAGHPFLASFFMTNS